VQTNPRALQTASSSDRRESYRATPEPQKEKDKWSVEQDAVPEFCALVVDRDSMSSDLLANVLRREKAYNAAAVAAPDLLPILSKSPVDLVVIGAEVILNARSGLDLTQAVSRAYPNLLLVVLLNRSTRESVINAFRSGARGVFSRERPIEEFLECIEHVRNGLIWVQGKDATFLLEAIRSVPAPNLAIAIDTPQLTSRQLQVVQYAAAGKTNKFIAAELRLSEHTVKNYLFRAFEKLGVSSRVELLFYLTLSGHSFAPSRVNATTDLVDE
jgi:DNA-binding NarL/FixJ family response regulator